MNEKDVSEGMGLILPPHKWAGALCSIEGVYYREEGTYYEVGVPVLRDDKIDGIAFNFCDESEIEVFWNRKE